MKGRREKGEVIQRGVETEVRKMKCWGGKIIKTGKKFPDTLQAI